jgi:hypothetical protein
MSPLDGPKISDTFKDAAEHNALARKRGTPPPFSLRLTAQEKAALLKQAGSMPLGAYSRSRLLRDDQAPRRAHRQPVKDDQALARLLAELRTARLSNNLNQLAKAVNTNSLPVTPDTEKTLQKACRDVQWMRDTLVAALGLRPGGPG